MSNMWWSAKHGNWWGVLDTLGHWLHLPRRFQNPICDRYDRSLGMYDEPVTATASSSSVKVEWKRRG